MEKMKRGAPMAERGIQNSLVGTVVSNKMDKTALVAVNRIKKHKTYQKYVERQKKYMAHDPQNLCQIGDRVKIIETRPLSKRKRWQILEIIEKASLDED